MFNSKDDNDLMDRQLFFCPNEIHYDYECRPLPESTPQLKAIFEVIDMAHLIFTTSIYTLQYGAKQEFIAIHDMGDPRILLMEV